MGRPVTFNPNKMNLLWLYSPFFEEMLTSLDLSESDQQKIKFYKKYGYLKIEEPIVPLSILDDAIATLQSKYTHSPTGYSQANRVQDAWKFNQAVLEIATSPAVLKTLQLLYQRRPIPFQTLNFEKGTEQKTHSDTIHFHSVPERFMCGVWVALEDIGPENGPLHYYPESHTLPIYTMNDIGLPSSFEYYQQYEFFIESLIQKEKLKITELHIKKGQALIWEANLLHGGQKILKPNSTRYSQATHYFFENCMYYSPCASDPYIGYMALRKIFDLSTKKTVPNLYNGKKISIRKLKRPKTLPELFEATKRKTQALFKSFIL